jgi:hypothetical protein
MRLDSLALFVFSFLPVCFAVCSLACSVKDVSLGGTELTSGGTGGSGGTTSTESSTAADTQKSDSGGISAEATTDGNGGYNADSGADVRVYMDAGQNDGAPNMDTGRNNQPWFAFVFCGDGGGCPNGYVCCNQICILCMAPDESCSQQLCLNSDPDACDPTQCGAAPNMSMPAFICPDGTMGGLVCKKTSESICTWKFVPCLDQSSAKCGNAVDAGCAADQYCDAPECGHGSEGGTCQRIPWFCPEAQDPVCGCDGNRYANSCLAHAAGTEVDPSGKCQ